MNKLIYLTMRGTVLFFREFRRNILSVVTLITLIFIYHVFFNITMSVGDFLKGIGNFDTLRVYLNTNDEGDIAKVRQHLSIDNRFNSIIYLTESDAKEYLIKSLSGNKDVANIPADLFPNFFILKFDKDISSSELDNIVANLKAVDGVKEVSYGKDYRDAFSEVYTTTVIFMLLLTVILSIAIIFTFYNTIRLSLYRYSNEIKIYNLVGATRPFIMLPYLVASKWQAIFAYIVATILFIIFNGIASTSLKGADIFILKSPSVIYYIITFSAVILISFLSTSSSLIRFLKKARSINEG